MRIIATVNGTPISDFDLKRRTDLTIALARLPNTPESRRQVSEQILRALVDEELKLQEADKLGINISEQDLQRAVANYERSNGWPKGGLDRMLKSKQIDKSLLMRQVRADLGWNSALQRRYRLATQVSTDELDEEINRIEADKGKVQSLVAEIFLAAANDGSTREAQQIARRLIKELRRGSPFTAVAQNFSQSSTAAIGGDLGWVTEGELPPELDDALQGITPGRLAGPIITEEGVYILLVRDQRISEGLNGHRTLDPKIKLHQLVFPLEKNPNPESVALQTGRAEALSARATNCATFDSLAPETGSSLSGPVGTLKTSALPDNLRQIVKDLAVQVPSAPVQTANGIVVLMVCGREGSAGNGRQLSQRQARQIVRNRIVGQRLGNNGRQYLRDIRRSAYIEFR